MIRADLHIHTYYSDGLLSPNEVAATAKRNGLNLISVTDHDTVSAYGEVKKACGDTGLKCVKGIEVSAYSNGVKLHTLGYNFKQTEEMEKFLKELYDGSFARTREILKKLKAVGVNLTLEEVLAERKKENTPLHGMFIARAGCKKGYSATPFSFYAKYLNRGCAGFSDIGRPSPERTVEIISLSGGAVSLAHPQRVEMEKEELFNLIKSLKDRGLYGIEGVYSSHTKSETEYYKEIARELGLEITGGSDTHFTGGNREIGSPEFYPSETLLAKLLS